jgi:hypothetical protein
MVCLSLILVERYSFSSSEDDFASAEEEYAYLLGALDMSSSEEEVSLFSSS